MNEGEREQVLQNVHNKMKYKFSTLTNQRIGIRFKDYPNHRYKIDCEEFNIYVNKEEHLMFSFNSS